MIKKFFSKLLFVVLLLLMIVTPVSANSGVDQQAIAPQFDQTVTEVLALLGFAAFISLVVNILKFFGVVKDGTADKWVAGFNLVGILALYFVRLFLPTFDPLPIDNVLAQIAAVGGFILSYLTMIFGSKITYKAVRGLPMVGKSHSLP